MAVKRQVKKSVGLPLFDDIGKKSKTVPIRTVIKKLPRIICVELNLIFVIVLVNC